MSSTQTLKRPSRPRAASSLGGDPRGDTSVGGFSTLLQKPYNNSVKNAEEKALRPNSKRRKAKSLFRTWKQISFRHTWLTPLIIILAIVGAYAANPSPHNPLHHALFISYPNKPILPGGKVMYGKGLYDIIFVAFYTVVFTFTREFLMQRVIRPMAIACGIRKKAKQARFMEQLYTAIYFGFFGPFGLYVMKYSENGALWYFNTTNMFEGFPHKQHEAIFKAYYLLQGSYWAQQGLVLMLQLEAPRKDFKELVLHHVVTLSLIGLSYRFHFAKMGIAVFISHDISDFFLATSKTLNYLDSIIVGPYFGFFIAVWVYLRHYINLHILYATLTEFRTVGPYELDWAGGQFKCLLSQVITFGLLASLQAVNLFWLFLILRIAKNYVLSSGLQDERSDDEGDEEGHEKKGMNGSNVKKQLEQDTGMTTDHPVLLVNGEPIDAQAKPEGIKQRKKA